MTTRINIYQRVLVFVLFLLGAVSSQAQTLDYSVLIDSDNSSASGCDVSLSFSGTTVNGIEKRLTAVVVSGQVTAVSSEACNGSAFDLPVPVDGNFPYPLGVNTSLNNAVVVELAATVFDLVPDGGEIRLYFTVETATGDDLIASVDDAVAGSGPILYIIQSALIPVLNSWGIFALLIVLIIGVAWWRRRPSHTALSALVLFSVFGLVIAANFNADGNLGDWAGETPDGIDSGSDGTIPAELLQCFVAEENAMLYFRCDSDPMDDPPVAVADLPTVDEDSPAITIDVLVNDTDDDGGPIAIDSVTQPANGTVVNNGSDVTYQPNADFCNDGSPTDDFSYTLTPGGSTATVSVTVTCINDQPDFTATDPAAVDEDAGAQTVNNWATFDPGVPSEAGQSVLAYNISNVSNPALFAAGPSVDTSGNLSFTPADDANGSSTFDVVVQDDGGTANGGVDTSAAQTFTITVNPVNDAPAISATDPPTVVEDAGAQTVNGWATFNPGPTDEAGQSVVAYAVSNVSNPGLFAAAPSVDSSGNLTYTPAADANGSSTFDIQVQDDGGTANGGVDLSAIQTFTIMVTAVNDQPSFTAVDPPAVNEDAGAQTVNGWAAFAPGPADEAGQSVVVYTVSNVSNPGLFAVTPSVDNSGNLTYTPADDANGSSTFDVTVQDDGGTSDGGVDTSTTQTFTITVNPVDDPPVAVDDDATITEDDPATIINVLVNDFDIDFDPFTIATVTQPGNGTVVNNTTDLTYQPDPDYCNDGSITDNFTYTLTPGGDSATVSMTVSCQNDPPVLMLPGPNTQYSTAAVLIDPTATVTDVDSADFDGGTVTAEVTDATCDMDDMLLVNNQGVGPGQISISGNDISFGATPDLIGTITTDFICDPNPPGAGNILLQIDLNSNATPAIVEILVQNLQFDTSAIAIVTDRSVEITVSDGDTGTSTTEAKTVVLDMAPEVDSTTPADNATGVAVDSNVTITFSENVNAPAAAFGINCDSGIRTFALSGGPTTFTLNPNTDFDNGETCTVTVTAAQVADQDTIDPPDNMASDFSFDFTTVDVAPQVNTFTPSSPPDQPIDTTIMITFTEAVDINNSASGAFEIECPDTSGALSYTTGALNNVTSVMLTPDANLPVGQTCTVDITAARITDVDTVDGPDQLTGTTSFNFITDAQPTFSSSNPANGASGVALASTVQITFSEAVDAVVGDFALVCNSSTQTFTVGGSGTATITLTPSSDLPMGANCTVTLNNSINDTDAIDPPDNYSGNVPSFSFTSLDDAPTVLASSTPANAAIVPTDQIITLNFSELVNVVPANISLTCNAAVTPFTASGVNNVTSITLTPDAALPAGANCTLNVPVNAATDVDLLPDQLGMAFSRSFSVDAAPAVTTTVPANNATNVTVSDNIVVNFSEAVDVSNASFTIGCPAAQTFVVTGTGSNSITLNPTVDLLGGVTCTVTVVAANVTDADAVDPPNNMVANVVFSFQTAAIANDDAYTVTPHLTYASPTGVRNNDIPTNATITGFGNTLPTANGTIPNGSNFVTADGAGGRVILNADGTFTYLPDAGDTSPATATFFYTLMGGDTAQVTLSFESEELVWFVDSTPTSPVCTTTNTGTQACPAATLGAVAGVDSADDTIFIASGSYICGITLETNERLIGDGSGSDLETISGVTPVAGSDFAPYTTFSGTKPVLTAGGTCITLASGNTLRGFAVGNSGTDITGGAVGNLFVREVSVNGTGVGINITTSGLLDVIFDEVSSTDNTGINLNNVSGDFDVTTGTINSGNNIAVSIDGNSSIDLGVTLASVSSNGATSSGIILADTTGSSGGFTVNGGTINNSTDDGIYMTNARDISLTGMSITSSTGNGVNLTSVTDIVFDNVTIDGAGTHGINGSTVTNFTFRNNGLVDNAGDANEEHGMRFRDLFGTNLIQNSTISNMEEDGIQVINDDVDDGTIDVLTIDNTAIETNNAAGFGENCLTLRAQSNGNLRVIVTNTSILQNCEGDAINAAADGVDNNGFLDVQVFNSMLQNNDARGIAYGTANNQDLDYDVLNGTSITGNTTTPVVTVGNQNSIMNGRIGNTVGTPANDITITGSQNVIGGVMSRAVEITADDNTTMIIQIDDSDITEADFASVRGISRNTAQLDFTLDSNTASTSGNGFEESITIVAGTSTASDTGSICLNMLNNTASTGGGVLDDYRLRIRQAGNTFELQDFVGSGAVAGDVQTWVNTTKSNTGTALITINASAFSAAAMPCATPPP